MKNFFNVDGKFYIVMSKIVDLFFAVLLWLVGCLPVVTIIPSTSTMYYVVVKCIRYDEGSVFAEFKEAYRNNLKQGIGLTLLFGSIGVLLGFADYRIFALSTNRSGLFFVVVVGMLILNVVYLLNVLWIVPVFSRFSNTFGNMLKLNYVIAMKNLIRSIPMLVVIAVAVVLFLAVNELIFILPSLIMLINSRMAEPALWRYMPEQEEDNRDWRYGVR